MDDAYCADVPDQVVVITTSCVAEVEEEWTLRAPADVARQARASQDGALALLHSDFVVSVGNVDVGDERDRVVISVVCGDSTTPGE